MNFMLPHKGKGKELQELLRRELGVPDAAVSFSVHFATGEIVKVQCEYMPREVEPIADGTNFDSGSREFVKVTA